MNERVGAALRAPYHRVFNREEDGGYSAFVLELPGVNAAGASISEANEDLENAIESWVEIELERGHDIPDPLDPERYSGRTQIRIPPSTHQRAQMVAMREGISLNRFISDAIAMAVGAEVSGRSGRVAVLRAKRPAPAKAAGRTAAAPRSRSG